MVPGRTIGADVIVSDGFFVGTAPDPALSSHARAFLEALGRLPVPRLVRRQAGLVVHFVDLLQREALRFVNQEICGKRELASPLTRWSRRKDAVLTNEHDADETRAEPHEEDLGL